MKIIAAPDSYKGSVSAVDVAKAMERGILAVFPDAEVCCLPISDGGEGLVETLVSATGGALRETTVIGPLGEPISAVWGILGDEKTAVIEMSAASGLPLISQDLRDPCKATTYGTGQLIKAVLDEGMDKLIIGLGGSATNDGGTGAMSALGVRFLDKKGENLPPGGEALSSLYDIDLSGLDPRLKDLDIQVACDVDNPLCGPAGATAVFGPQKGVTEKLIPVLDGALAHYAGIARAKTGKDAANISGAGAAGGLGAGLLFFTQAVLRPGIELVLDTVNFDAHAEEAELVLVGEGHTDFQTAHGKAPVGVAKAAKKFNLPVICLSGGLGKGSEEVLCHGVDALMSTPSGCMTIDECIALGAQAIEDATIRMCRLLKIGMRIRG